MATHGDLEPLGRHWIEGFLRRNPGIRSTRDKAIASERVNGATTKKIKEFFTRLSQEAIHDIPPDRRFNADEVGSQEGLGFNGLALVHAGKTIQVKKYPGSRCWITILECISVIGQILRPLVILKGKNLQLQWFPTELRSFSSWNFTAIEKGWIDDSVALRWLREVFIPETKPLNKERRLVILYGHGSHTTIDFIWECYISNIFLLFLPPYSSHVLQPLDLAVFSPVKQRDRH